MNRKRVLKIDDEADMVKVLANGLEASQTGKYYSKVIRPCH